MNYICSIYLSISYSMKSFKIGDLTVKLPIIQGGMGVGVSLSGLASAVANEGGVGVISCAGIGLLYPRFSKDYLTNSMMGLREELRKARAKTRGIVGVNVMVALSNFSDMVRTAISEKADIIFSGAGLPLDLPSYLREDSTTKLVPIVSSARAAPRDMRKMEGELRLSARRSGCRGPPRPAAIWATRGSRSTMPTTRSSASFPRSFPRSGATRSFTAAGFR